MRFIETLGAGTLFVLKVTGQSAFYCRQSISGRLMLRCARWLRVRPPDARRLEIGDLQSTTGARSSAYEAAERVVGLAEIAPWAVQVGHRLNIDFPLIVEKFLFEQAFEKFLFFELVTRYVTENPQEPHSLVLNRFHADIYLQRLAALKQLSVHVVPAFSLIKLLMALLALPSLLLYHLWRSMQISAPEVEGRLICAVDAHVTQAMFCELFSNMEDVQYVVEAAYAHSYSLDARSTIPASVLGLSASARRKFCRLLPFYLWYSLRSFLLLERYGALPFLLFHLLCQGRAITIEGKNNVFVTFEHLTLPRAIRNEFLRAAGSVSVFVSKNCYVTFQQYSAERKSNYDVFCASGPHAEALYIKKRSLIRKFLYAGSYDAHRQVDGIASQAAYEKEATLLRFKQNDQLVVILSPGVCDETRSNEKRLMQLANKLAQLPGVKVAVRLKPGPIIDGYESFYRDIFGAESPVLLTGGEFDLLDFLTPADLFVTSISTSACDMALRGGRVMFVDFMQTPDLYLPWEKVPEIVSTEEAAYEKISNWLADDEGGAFRREHDFAMSRFVACLGYKFDSFDAYKANLLTELAPWLSRIGPPKLGGYNKLI